MSITIRREIEVKRKGLPVVINATYGTDLIQMEFKVTDCIIPTESSAVAYSQGRTAEVHKQICTIDENVISFTPEKGFFEEGRNELQLRVVHNNRSLFTFKCRVECQGSFADSDAEEVKRNSSLVEQLMTEQAVTKAKLEEVLKLSEDGSDVEKTLNDIKVGVDGKVYSSPGEAVRQQIGQVSEQKIDNPNTGLIGQILEIESVDKNGKPKTYKAVDKPKCNTPSFFCLNFYDYCTKNNKTIGVDGDDLSDLLQEGVDNSTIVYIPKGDYKISKPVVITKDVIVYGDGINSTTLYGDVIFNVLINATWFGYSLKTMTLRSLSMNPNEMIDGKSLVYIVGNADPIAENRFGHIENCAFLWGYNGLTAESTALVKVDNCVFYAQTGTSITLDSDSQISNCYVTASDIGIKLSGSNNRVTSCKVYRCGRDRRKGTDGVASTNPSILVVGGRNILSAMDVQENYANGVEIQGFLCRFDGIVQNSGFYSDTHKIGVLLNKYGFKNYVNITSCNFSSHQTQDKSFSIEGINTNNTIVLNEEYMLTPTTDIKDGNYLILNGVDKTMTDIWEPLKLVPNIIENANYTVEQIVARKVGSVVYLNMTISIVAALPSTWTDIISGLPTPLTSGIIYSSPTRNSGGACRLNHNGETIRIAGGVSGEKCDFAISYLLASTS